MELKENSRKFQKHESEKLSQTVTQGSIHEIQNGKKSGGIATLKPKAKPTNPGTL